MTGERTVDFTATDAFGHDQTSISGSAISNIYITGNGGFSTPAGTSFELSKTRGISPKLYFKYVKSKFGLLGGMRFEKRINKLWKLAEKAESTGQIALSEEFLKKVMKETRETEMYGFGYKVFVEKDYLEKFMYKVKGRGISFTKLKNYTRNIPDDVQKKIKEATGRKLFDEFVIVHYDESGTAVKKTEEEERKDPIVFGRINESDRYYFIADWEDEFCDLTLDDIVDKLSLDDEDITLSKNPSLDK
jgi:hypothetical protein